MKTAGTTRCGKVANLDDRGTIAHIQYLPHGSKACSGWDDILKRIREKPFRQFRIIASEGERFEMCHPDWVLVGSRDLTIGHPGPDPAVYDGVTRVGWCTSWR